MVYYKIHVSSSLGSFLFWYPQFTILRTSEMGSQKGSP